MSFPANVIPVFGSQRAYADLNFAGGSFGLDGRIVNDPSLLSGWSFTRASLAMGYDATGKLTYGPNNLLLQSQTFQTTWSLSACAAFGSGSVVDATTAPDGTLTADFVNEGSANSAHRVEQTVTTPGSPVTLSVYAKANGRNWIYLRIADGANAGQLAWFNIATGAVGTSGAGWTTSIQSAGNGWYRCVATLSSSFAGSNSFRVGLANADNNQSYQGDGTSGIYLWGAQLEAVTYQTTPSTYYPTTTAAHYGPRLVYDPVTLASQGILVEEARTNLALYSQTFDVAQWGRNEGALTNNATTAPDGTSTASSFIPTAGAVTLANTNFVPTLTDSLVYTASCFLKKNGYDWAKVIIRSKDSASESGAWFNLNTGAVGTVDAGITAAIQSVGNGWYRCSVSKSAGTGATSPRFRIASTNADNVLAFTANGTSGLFLWQADFQLGTGASSPIPTTTASVTRAADVALVTGLSVPNPHSMAAEWTPGFDNGSSFRRIGALTNSGGTSEDSIYHRHTNNLTRIYTSADMDLLLGTANATTANKAAGRFELNNSAGSLNGAATVAPDTSTTPTTGIDRLLIGVGLLSTGPLNGTISRIRIYNRALSDAQLQSLST